uniref:B12D-like protein n=1 Tax=Castanea sativa TaxID=21020 RepID=Q940E1_CASSA|nr:B12D-like protein [Castanea sativa]
MFIGEGFLFSWEASSLITPTTFQWHPPPPTEWLRPEVYPLFATVGVAVGICAMQLVRNICTNPEVRVTKENNSCRKCLHNFEEGEKYSQHAVRKFVLNRSPHIMPSLKSFFSEPKYFKLQSNVVNLQDCQIFEF